MPESSESRFAVPSEPGKLIRYLEEKWECAAAIRPELQPRLNLAFTDGFQWLVFDRHNGQLRKPTDRVDDPNAPIRLTINKVGGIVERVIARLTKNFPTPECRPVSDEEDDVSTARVGTRILAHETNRLKLAVALPELYSWVVPVGWGYMQITWDTKQGQYIGNVENELGETKNLYVGEICREVVPHFEVAFDPAALDISSARWAIRTIALTGEEIWERWGIEIDADTPGVRTLADELGVLSEASRKRGNEKKFAVRQLWMPRKMMRSAPRGMTAVWAGNQFIESPKPFPYDHNKIPLVQFDFWPPRGTPFGRTMVDDLLPMQQDYNDSRSRQATIRRTLTPKFIYPMGSVDPEKVTARGEQIPYNDALGAAPRYEMPDARWSTQFEQGQDRSDAEMGDRSGINDASTGNLTGSSPAATVITQQESATEPLLVPAMCLADGIEQVGWQILMLVKQFWKEKRLVRAWSEAGTLEVDRFSNADIEGRFDVHVTQESAMPRSKAARAQLAIELWQQQIIPDARTLVRMLDLPSTDVLTTEFNVDVRKQEREIGSFIRGKQVPINSYDNHEVEASVLMKWMKSAEFEKQPNKVKDIAKDHLRAHMAIVGTQIQNGAGPAAQSDAQAPPGEVDPRNLNGDAAGVPTEGMPDVPAATDIAMVGGRTGQPGLSPLVDPDTQLAAMGE